MANEETNEETESTVPGLSRRSALTVHQGQVDWIQEEHDVDLSELSPAEIISVAYATRNPWRKTDIYTEMREEEVERREAERAERAELKAQRDAEKAEKAKAEKAEKAKTSKSSGKGKGKGKKAPAKKASKSKAAEETEEDPFE